MWETLESRRMMSVTAINVEEPAAPISQPTTTVEAKATPAQQRQILINIIDRIFNSANTVLQSVRG
jgi:hypothetical protein